MRVRWLARASIALRDVHSHIAKDNPRAAGQIVAAIEAAADRLTLFRNMGRAGTVNGTRELVVPDLPYVIVYRTALEEVQILRLFHTSTDWQTHLH